MTKFTSAAFAALLLAVAVTADVIEPTPCDNKPENMAIVKQLKIEGCKAMPCILKRKGTATFDIEFTPNVDAEKVTMDAFGHIGTVDVPWPGQDKDGCKEEFNMKCPVKAGTLYHYKNPVAISENYPPIPVDVKWKILLDNKPAACFIIKVKIQ